jgi:hypothetical protein
MNKIMIRNDVFVTIDDDRLDELSKYQWHLQGGYAIRRMRLGITVSMQHEVVGPVPKGYIVHHINQDKLDNRRSNLLIVMNHYHKCLHQGLYQRRPDKLPKHAIISTPMVRPATPSI